MKILCAGLNYAEHNKELGDALLEKEPVIFLKPESALLRAGLPFFVPDWAERFDYEAEVAVRICRLGKDIEERFAHRYYDALTVGIDFTARDLEHRLRAKSLPWTLCKSFDQSAAVGLWVPVEGLGDVQDLHFRLAKNGQTVQQGWTGDMVHGIDRLVAFCSRFFTLKHGDILFTGTPAGIGPVAEGDVLEGWLDEVKVLQVRVK